MEDSDEELEMHGDTVLQCFLTLTL